MVSTTSKRGTQFASLSASDDRAVERAGVDAVFAQAKPMGPLLLQLQRGLAEGLKRSQLREAERLEKKDKQDPRAASARLRAERIGTLAVDLERVGQAAERFVQGMTGGGMFHGYVVDAAGAPAVGHVVRLGSREQQEAHQAKTDEMGYFRIEFDAPGVRKKTLEEIMAAARDKQGAAAMAGGTGYDPADTGVEVDILNPAGKIVFRDPAPPDFRDLGEAVFRFYPLVDLKNSDLRGSGARAAASS